MELWLSLLQEQRLSSSLISAATTRGSSSSSRQLQAERLLASSSQDTSESAAFLNMEHVGSSDPACFMLDVHRLEGVFFMLLCSYDESIRLDAYGALGLVRTLHTQLFSMAEQLGLHQQGEAAQPQPQQAARTAGAAAPGGGAGTAGSFSSVSTLAAPPAASDAPVAAASTPAAGSVASGSGIFFRHKATASRDSAEFMQVLGESTGVQSCMYVHLLLLAKVSSAVRAAGALQSCQLPRSEAASAQCELLAPSIILAHGA